MQVHTFMQYLLENYESSEINNIKRKCIELYKTLVYAIFDDFDQIEIRRKKKNISKIPGF